MRNVPGIPGELTGNSFTNEEKCCIIKYLACENMANER